MSRLLIELPPRHGKSELCSRYFPAWYKGVFPDRNVILTSATDDLAIGFSASVRELLREHGQEVFNVRLSKDRQAKDDWAIEGGGQFRAAGVGGGIMGRGADLLIVDDYFKNSEEALSERQREKVLEWFQSTATTRLSPQGAVIVIATRWHRKDLIGQLLSAQAQGGDQWARIRLPAICDRAGDLLGRKLGEALWPEQWPIESLQQKRHGYCSTGYEWQWEALYQQNPPEVIDAEWPAAYFTDDVWVGEWPNDIQARVVALDPSLAKSDSSDYQAMVAVGVDAAGVFYVEAELDRLDTERLCDAAVQMQMRHRPVAFGVESNSYQSLLKSKIDEKARQCGVVMPTWSIENRENKQTRIRYWLTPFLAQKRVRFIGSSAGTHLLVEQLRGFPSCKYDDGPDAMAMGFDLLANYLSLEHPVS